MSQKRYPQDVTAPGPTQQSNAPQPTSAEMAHVARVLEKIARQLCPHCDSKHLVERGRSVYCGDCGARLYLGKLFPPMKEPV